MEYTLSMDVQHQVVEKVLKGYLEDDALSSAVSLWDQHYSGQSSEKLSFFVFEIATTSALRHLRKNILQELERNLTTEPAQNTLVKDSKRLEATQSKIGERPQYIPSSNRVKLEEIPLEKLTIDLAKEDVDGLAIVNIVVLFEFFQMLKTSLHTINLNELASVLDEYLSEAALPHFVKQELVELVLKQGGLYVLPYDQEHIRKVTNILYSILCEYHGPVRTDRLMMQAITHLEQKYPNENLRQFL